MNNFDTLVLSGGGFKGFIQLGALHYLYDKGLDLDVIKNFSGTSIGSAICLLLVVGYKPIEIFKKLLGIKFGNYIKINSFQDIISNIGFLNIDEALIYLDELVNQKLGNIPTLLELYKRTNKTFFACTAIVEDMTCEYLSYKTHPHLLCTKAVKMSSNVPFIFGKTVVGGKSYVDGGVLNNIPIEPVMNKIDRILTIITVGHDNTSMAGVASYFYKILAMPINTITELRSFNLSDNVKVIKIRKDNVPILNVNSTEADKIDLFNFGYKSCKHSQKVKHIHIPNFRNYLVI